MNNTCATLEENTCRDCTHYNQKQEAATQISKAKKRPRPTNHGTGNKLCPTLLAFQKKALPTLAKAAPTTSNP